jgi:hydroxycarboxylate dehydrogenase B
MLETDPRVDARSLGTFGSAVMRALGASPSLATEIAEHLVDADLCGVYSHGVFRLDWYAQRHAEGRFDASAEPRLGHADGGAELVDGGNNLGMPALRLAVDHLVSRAKRNGVAAMGVANVDHTGRLGAFAQRGAQAGCLTILIGGGARKDWPQVAPYGGARGMLPTNPFAFAVPGGAHGPVVVDFATGMAAGGKIYAARMAGRPLAEGLCIDAQGRPTTDPEDYFQGGAILPMAGPKGYGMALIAELLGEAILGQVRDGLNWIAIAVDLGRYRAPEAYRQAAEACLAEMRACPPAPGFDRVEVPGEREARLHAERMRNGIPVAPDTLEALRALGRRLQLDETALLP